MQERRLKLMPELPESLQSEAAEPLQSEAAPESVPAPDRSTEQAKRERSQIKFPYTDIDDAVLVASKIKELHGQSCGLDQLAVGLGSKSIASGSFRTKLATASTFGAVKNTRGSVELTDLGHRLADEHTRPAALVDAFLHVPLYKEIYDRYYQKSLPGDAGLESDMRNLKVAASQTVRARQVFQRSAAKAGFFWGGSSRLILPASNSIDHGQPEVGESTPAPEPSPEGRSALANPLLAALMQRMLPAENEPFSAHERSRFFRALAVNLDAVYGEPDDGELDLDSLKKLYRTSSVENATQ
jgi:hypothetical protein